MRHVLNRFYSQISTGAIHQQGVDHWGVGFTNGGDSRIDLECGSGGVVDSEDSRHTGGHAVGEGKKGTFQRASTFRVWEINRIM